MDREAVKQKLIEANACLNEAVMLIEQDGPVHSDILDAGDALFRALRDL
jgi:hypothetical protein